MSLHDPTFHPVFETSLLHHSNGGVGVRGLLLFPSYPNPDSRVPGSVHFPGNSRLLFFATQSSRAKKQVGVVSKALASLHLPCSPPGE